jgi:hypothetical protein
VIDRTAKSDTTVAEVLRPTEECVHCGAMIADSYCSHCGERRASERRHSLGEFCREVIEAFVSVDGRAGRTLLSLALRPGELTVAFMRGVRKPYLSPFNCFLLANLVYFVWATAVGSNTFATPLSVHTQQTPYRRLAQEAVTARLAASHEDPNAFVARFDAMGRTQAKSLVIVMVPAFAVAVALVAIGTRRTAIHDIAFAFHIFSAILPIMMAAQILAGLIGLALRAGLLDASTPSPSYIAGDMLTTLIAASAIGAYIYAALRRAYGMNVPRAVASTPVLLLALLVIVTAYRGMLFEATLHSIS